MEQRRRAEEEERKRQEEIDERAAIALQVMTKLYIYLTRIE